MRKDKKIEIYDTTLRDGAQAEGIYFTVEGKIRCAKRLADFGIDYIEGGFAGANKKDMEFFKLIRREDLKETKIVAFGSTRRANTTVKKDFIVNAMLEAATPVVVVCGKAWDLHVKDVLRTSFKENLLMIKETVEFMKDKNKEVIFDAEHFFDGYKNSPEYSLEVVDTAMKAGADTVVLCDTNGGALPHEIERITREVVTKFSIKIGIHLHNDSGTAVAGSLMAVIAGASHIQGTINGYGERCGNADLCSVIPNLVFKMGYSCKCERSLKDLREVSLFVDDIVNMRPNPKSPYVGLSAFSHKAGQHADAVKKNPKTCEHISPELVGNKRRFLVSEMSGKSNILLKAAELNLTRDIVDNKENIGDILNTLKDMESKGYSYEAADGSFKILVQKILKRHKSFFHLDGFRVIVEKRGMDQPCIAEATIKVRVNDTTELTAAEGCGPVDALDKALRKALIKFYPSIKDVVLTDFRVRILDPEEATEATTRVVIESKDHSGTWGTVGVSPNIIDAAWQALVDSVEYKLFKDEEEREKNK